MDGEQSVLVGLGKSMLVLMLIGVRFGGGRGGLRVLIELGRGRGGRVGGGSGRLLLRLGWTFFLENRPSFSCLIVIL